jgi:cell division topological specificity factor
MSVVSLFRYRGSAPVARERLQTLLSYDRAAHGHRDLLAVLREEILATIAKHVTVDHDNVHIEVDRGARGATLDIDVEIPHSVPLVRMAVAPRQPDK